jgi:hypothetical protein
LRIFCAGATGLFVSIAAHLVPAWFSSRLKTARFPLLVAHFP